MMKLKTALLTILLATNLIGISYADYQNGKNSFNKGDYKTAIKEFKSSANQGNAAAQNFLGIAYENGLGALVDYKEAATWYRKSADQGNAAAQNNLGALYIDGMGVHKSLTEAKRLIKMAYENPDVGANTKSLAEEYWKEFELWKY